jgi:hypothetical protein
MQIVRAAMLAAFAFAAVPANAALIHDYTLNHTLADAKGGAAITNNGGALGATGITFAANQGPTLGGFSNFAVYSVEVAFSFDSAPGYRKILDFKSLASDNRLNALNQNLDFHPMTTSPSVDFTSGKIANVVLTRDAAGLTVGYVDGVAKISFSDTSGLGVFTSAINFLSDDFVTGGREASSGFVDYVRIYDTALTAAQVAKRRRRRHGSRTRRVDADDRRFWPCRRRAAAAQRVRRRLSRRAQTAFGTNRTPAISAE